MKPLAFFHYSLILLLAACLAFTPAGAQQDSNTHAVPVTLSAYLYRVGRDNLSMLSERLNVNIAEAGIESAKVFPDPGLSAGVYDNQDTKLHLGTGVNTGLSATLELGGKRKARIGLARSQAELSRALLQDYLRNLRADAALAYFNTLLQQYRYQVTDSSYKAMQQLADADSIRLRAGAIAAIDARQSRLEAMNLLAGRIQSANDQKTAMIRLSLLCGHPATDTLLQPGPGFGDLDRSFSLMALITQAQEERADAIAARNARIVADKSLALIRANRKIDLGLSAGLQFSGEATNETAPTPAYRSISAGVSIPLKLSNIYKGELKAAQYSRQQSELQYRQVLLQIQTEVMQAYMDYRTAGQKVAQYHSSLLEEAKKILEGKVYSYKRGETSLLEVLNAQRTSNDIRQDYYQALYDYAAALIGLERSAGIWDLQ